MDIGVQLNTNVKNRLLKKLRSYAETEETDEEILRRTSNDKILSTLGDLVNAPYFKNIQSCIQPDFIEKFPVGEIKEKMACPLRRDGNRITVAYINPYDTRVENIIKSVYSSDGQPIIIQKIITNKSNLLKLSSKATNLVITNQEMDSIEVYEEKEDIIKINLEETHDDDPLMRLVVKILKDAVDTGTSDIHLRCDINANDGKNELYYHYRIDGSLQKKHPLPWKFKERLDAVLINQLPGVKPEEKNIMPGISGRILLQYLGRNIGVRYERTRSYRGYHITMRLLDKDGFEPKLGTSAFPFPDAVNNWMFKLLETPVGIIVMSGPTGSGKSTTLNAMLREINRPDTAILTLENPVEDEIPGVIHHQMNDPKEFPLYMKSFMRADPDKMFIGEVRDQETAELAVEAALTGHQVLTTTHANTASQVIERFEQLGIDKNKIAQALRGAMAQRLLKRLCPSCKIPQGGITKKEIELFRLSKVKDIQGVSVDWENDTFYAVNNQGCNDCNSGYKGRIPVVEMIPIDDEVQTMLLNGKSRIDIERYAKKTYGLPTLKEEGLRLVAEGQSDLASVSKGVDLIFG